MDCKYAYTEASYDHILCKLETPPTPRDKASYFHALCTSQEFCPTKGCHKLSADWKDCLMRKEEARTPKKTVKTAKSTAKAKEKETEQTQA